MLAPHFVRDYRRLVRKLMLTHDRDSAMERAIGGGYDFVGIQQEAILRDAGLGENDYLVDVGCGSGRTAFALRAMASLRYHGTDVVPELLDYARAKAARPDWRFSLVEGLTIPDLDGSADMVAMFSVITHLTAREAQRYLAEAARVIRPGGKIVVSFLDPEVAVHHLHITNWFRELVNRLRGHGVRNMMHGRQEIARWAAGLALGIEFFGPERIGQSYFVLRKGAVAA